MTLKERIQEDMKAAMRARESERLSTIRMLLAACKQREVDERITLDDRPLAAWVRAWQDTGRRLGEAEAERTALEKKASATRPADALRARNKAIRVMNAFLTMLDLDEPSSEDRRAILGPLESALRRAARRGNKAEAAEDVDDAG